MQVGAGSMDDKTDIKHMSIYAVLHVHANASMYDHHESLYLELQCRTMYVGDETPIALITSNLLLH
jgi:hypothetical protein